MSTRRAFLGHSLAGSAILLTPSQLLAELLRAPAPPQLAQRPWLAAAMKAERWLTSVAQRNPRGIAWAADPTAPARISTDLYNGMAGVVLFYLELHNATGDRAALDLARGGADYLLSSVPDEPGDAPMGLYTGLAGTATVLALTHRLTKDARYQRGVQKILTVIDRAAQPVGRGVDWNRSTDIISGSAGIGLALLALGGEYHDVDTRRLAIDAGNRLIERGQSSAEGLSWLVQPDMPRNYPNFSHGTAGVSFYLARLNTVSRRREHLDAALSGERWLAAQSTTTASGGRMIYHSTPGNEQIFYLSWCHGPAGTARLYHGLTQATGDATWQKRIEELAVAIRDMKVPERSPGFWNNISQCCGNCGISEFFVALHRLRGDARHLEYAEAIAHDTLARATAEGDGLKWTQAEHRVRPELLVAQTGLMQGAAGVGLAMLHLDGAREGRKPLVRLPDDPF
ncbi:MAG TPA: lanthionine synthetase LanC family protein [Gemmatimonadaceae bacterium]